MDYFKILNLSREPFSNAPDPDLFYKTEQHNSCLQQLEIAIRLKRGLNIVIGEVGTGKTTLCRQLIRSLGEDSNVKCNLILDPGYSSPLSFLLALRDQLCPQSKQDSQEDELSLKEQIKSYLFDQVAVSGKTDLLIIDEGQKMPGHCLEILRELLNFESNTEKLLQIIIFAQPEFKNSLESMHNVADRINLYYELGPLSFRDCQNLILHRIEKSKIEYKDSIKFTLPALWAIYRSTGGFPRKIINLCHKITLALVMQQGFKVTWPLIRKCNKEFPGYHGTSSTNRRQLTYYFFACTVAVIALFFLLQEINLVPLQKGFVNNLFSSEHVSETDVAREAKNKTDTRITKEINKEPSNKNEDIAQSEKNAKFDSNISLLYPSSKLLPHDKLNKDLPASEEPEKNRKNTSELAVTAMPDSLGKLKVKDRENLWRLSEMVYGIKRPRIINQLVLKRLLDSNPHIQNRNLIRAQSEINFPVILFGHDITDTGYRLQFAKTNTLNSAYSKLHKHKSNISRQLLCTWQPGNGLHFYVISQETYKSIPEAKMALNSLSEHARNQTRVMKFNEQDFGKQTYFLSKLVGVDS